MSPFVTNEPPLPVTSYPEVLHLSQHGGSSCVVPAPPAQLPASHSWVLVVSHGESLPSRYALCSPALQMWFLQLQEPGLGSHLQVDPGKLRQKFSLETQDPAASWALSSFLVVAGVTGLLPRARSGGGRFIPLCSQGRTGLSPQWCI